MSARSKSIGIFGGTFNPPHVAHVAAAEAFSRRIDPDTLMIIPDFLPPHKTFAGTVTPEQRLDMCRLAFSHIKNVQISDMEIARGGKSYTANTLTELSKTGDELYAEIEVVRGEFEKKAVSFEEMAAYIAKEGIKCPDCGAADFTEIRKFNLMFKTYQGVTENSTSELYLRPETAQGIFVNFKNVARTTRKKMPFGVCQIGKSF